MADAGVDPKNTLYPITVLIDELKSDDKKKRYVQLLYQIHLYLLFRVNAVQNLDTICIALGKERTRNELMPYIMDLMDDEEEILI